jgi:hypothetical protein
MNLDHYPYAPSKNFKHYYFYSEGPNGRIKKTVIYSVLWDDPLVYNLAFGDEDLKTGMISDTAKSNNQDRDKVLATVASTVIDFMNTYGNVPIYAQGSTPSRTRLYQLSIAHLLDEITEGFTIRGFRNNNWELFQRNVNYEAFLVEKK